MRSLLERLLVLASPLFAAAATPKKTTAPKVKRSRALHPRSKTKPKGTRASSPQATRKAAAKAKERAPRVEHPAAPARKPQEQSVAKALPPTKPVEPQPKPSAPTGRAILLVPENGKYADSLPRFRWLSVGGANRYEVMWSDRPDFAAATSVTSIATEKAVPVEEPLSVGVTYYWHVRGGNEGGWGPWSSTASFQVLEGPPPS